MISRTQLWNLAHRFALLENHKTQASFDTAINRKFHELCGWHSTMVAEGGFILAGFDDHTRTQPAIDQLKLACGVT